MNSLRFFPQGASVEAGHVDVLFLALVGVSLAFIVAVFGSIVYFAATYRHTNHGVDRKHVFEDRWRIEVGLIGGLLVLSLCAFTWAGVLYIDVETPPAGPTLDIQGVAKQWVWTFEHTNGAREINALHVPVGQRVRIALTSEDVIHSFYVPAFRLKQDVLPGRTANVWVEATVPGRYHLFCAEYCGTDHSAMGGWVDVMEPGDYARWLALGATGGSDAGALDGRYDQPTADTPAIALGPGRLEAPTAGSSPTEPLVAESASAARGAALFETLNCAACHRADSLALYPARGPALAGVAGRTVRLQNGRTVLADASYLRESILYPRARLVQGYPPIMPSYRGVVSDPELDALVAYLESLGG